MNADAASQRLIRKPWPKGHGIAFTSLGKASTCPGFNEAVIPEITGPNQGKGSEAKLNAFSFNEAVIQK